MKQDVMIHIQKNYQRKRNQSKQDLEMRKSEIYDMLPRIREIDLQIAKFSLDLSRLLLNKPDNLSEQINAHRQSIQHLKSEKKSILKAKGIPEIYLKEVHSCATCRDTGYDDDGNMCTCYRQSLIDALYHVSGLKEVLKRENFDTFDLSRFDDIPFGKERLTPKDNMKVILKHGLQFADDFSNHSRNLLFYGGTGLGKTFMCNCIAKELINSGVVVLYQTSFKLFETISEHKFNRQLESPENKDNFNLIYHADLLIIDDLGAESINSFTVTELFNIINTRMITEKKTIISTNLSLEKLSELYSDRIISRLVSHYDIFKFYGKDIRTKRG